MAVAAMKITSGTAAGTVSTLPAARQASASPVSPNAIANRSGGIRAADQVL